MNIGELITTLGVDSSQLDQTNKKMEEFAKKVDTQQKVVNKVYEKQTGLIEDMQSHIKDLEVAKSRAHSTKDIARYNGYLEDSRRKLKDLENAGISAGEKQSSAIQKWIIGMASFAGAIYVAKKGWEAYKTIVNSAGDTHDHFEATMGGIQLATDRFFNILARKDFDNFVAKLKTAAKAGKDYVEASNQIKERTYGLSLEKAFISPGQMEREEIFRNPNADPVKRREALNKFKEEAVRLSTQDLAIANASVIAEENKLKALGVSTEKIKQLYLTYNTGIIDIQKAEEVRAAEVIKNEEIIAARKTMGGAQYAKEQSKLQSEYNKLYSSLTDGERLYIDLLDENAKVKEENIVAYLESLTKEKAKEAEIVEVGKNVVRVQSQIENSIDEQNKKLQKQIELYDQFVRKHMQGVIKRQQPKEQDLGILEQSIKDMEAMSEAIDIPKLHVDLIDTRDDIEKMTNGLYDQESAVNMLSDSFMGFFDSAETGWKHMLDTWSDMINRFLAEQAAKALLKFVLNMVAPGTGTAVTAGMNVIPDQSGFDISSFMGNVQNKGQNINVGGEFKIVGKDLVRVIERNA